MLVDRAWKYINQGKQHVREEGEDLKKKKKMSDGDYEKLQSDYEGLKKKTADWKLKVKEITLKDRQHIQDQKEEIDVLSKQLQNQKEIINDKTQGLTSITSKHEDLRQELVDTLSELQKVSQYKSKISELEDQLLRSESTLDILKTNTKAEKIKSTHTLSEAVQDRDNEITQKNDEITQLRVRITDHEKRNESLRHERDGTKFFTTDAKAVKRVSHEGNIWLLLEQSKDFRWFEKEILSVRCNTALETLQPDEEPTTQDNTKLQSLTQQLNTTREDTKRQKADLERQLTLKDQEVTRLLKRIETLQEEQSRIVLRQQQNDGSKMTHLREELETQIRDELAGQLSDLQYKHEQTISEVNKSKKDYHDLNTDYTQYKLRAQAAISKNMSQQESVLQEQTQLLKSEKNDLKSSLESLQEDYENSERTLSELKTTQKSEQTAFLKVKSNLTEALQVCEDTQREKNEAIQQLAKMKRKYLKSSSPTQSSTPPPTEPTVDLHDSEDDYKERLESADNKIVELQRKLDKTTSALKSVTDEMRSRDEYFTRTPTPPPAVIQKKQSCVTLDGDEETECSAPIANGEDISKVDGDHKDDDVSESHEKAQLLRYESCSSIVGTTSMDGVPHEEESFSVQDLVSAASLADGSPDSQLRWTERKVSRLTAENRSLRFELARLCTLPAEMSNLKEQIDEANRSIQRQDCTRHIDYLKNIILQFCLAKDNVSMQSGMIPLLASLLELSPEERRGLDTHYPQA